VANSALAGRTIFVYVGNMDAAQAARRVFESVAQLSGYASGQAGCEDAIKFIAASARAYWARG
jgi:hypothetical protein